MIGKKNKKEKKDTISFLQRISTTGQLDKMFLYLIIAIPSVLLIFLALISLLGFIGPLNIGGFLLGTTADYLIVSFLIATGIYGFYEFFRIRKIRKIDNRFPDFVRDLAESRRAGMTFTKAIMHASKGNYGLLSPEIEKIARQISWGSNVDTALSAFAKRLNTKLITRTISLIIEASRSGGNVADVLDAASKDARDIKIIQSERKANMLSYMTIIYVGFGVFLMIILIITKLLIPEMVKGSVSGLTINSGYISESSINSAFYFASLIQGMGMGIVAGVFEEGRVVSGIKHSFIMVLIIWLIFKLFLGM